MKRLFCILVPALLLLLLWGCAVKTDPTAAPFAAPAESSVEPTTAVPPATAPAEPFVEATASAPPVTAPAETGRPTASADPSEETEPLLHPDRDPLLGTWVNAGAYEEGRDFVETMTIEAEGTVRVHLDYQGSPYADLTGSWTRSGNSLTFSMSDGSVLVYEYSIDGRMLILTGNGKRMEFLRN